MINSPTFKLHYDKIIGESFKSKIEPYYKLIDSRLYSQLQKILRKIIHKNLIDSLELWEQLKDSKAPLSLDVIRRLKA